MEYSITDQEGATLKVDAENWLLALGMVLPAMDVDVNALGRISCVPDPDGSVFVDDPRAGRSWLIREVEDIPAAPPPLVLPPRAPPPPPAPQAPPPELKIMVSGRSTVGFEQPDEVTQKRPTEEPVPVDLSRPPPTLAMPVRASFVREQPIESLAERLFDLSMDLATMEPDEACNAALELVTEFVPSEAASIVRGTLDDDALTFVAAVGPVAERIRGRQVPFGEGLVGICYDMRENMVVGDVRQSVGFVDDLDKATGFQTRSVMCIPILDDEGSVFGVIEVINRLERPFGDDDVEAVETIARTLAGALAYR